MPGVSDLKYKQDLVDLEKPTYQVQPLFEISFTKPLTSKRKYYLALIDADAIHFLNYLHMQVREAINEKARKYHVHMALTRTLNEKLKETAQVIQEHDYNPKQYDHRLGSLPANTPNTDAAFIIGYLQHQLVRLYLEVQACYPNYLSEEALTEEDIYLKYFNHGAFTPSYIKIAERIETAKVKSPVIIEKKEREFTPRLGDFKTPVKGILSYKEIIRTPQRFNSVEESLFIHDYINENHGFTDKHGLKNELAMIYLHLIKKGYFNERSFPGNKKIDNLAIRKFLDHRYGTNLDKQFRTLKDQPELIASFIAEHHWLSSLPIG